MNTVRGKREGFRGVHALWAICVFFAAVIAVDAVFVIRAVATFPGEDTPNSYVQGIDYNTTLQRHAVQMRLGWEAEAGLQTIDGKQNFVVQLREATGKPVAGRLVAVRWRRIGTDVEDATLSLREIGDGVYATAFPLTGPGRIATFVDIRDAAGEEPVFVASKTVALPLVSQ